MLGTISRRTLAWSTPLALLAAVVALGLIAPRCSAEEVKGKYVVIDCPASERATGDRLAKLGDQALDLYVGFLGAKVPAEPFKVILTSTIADYEKAEAVRTHGEFKANLAFTFRDTQEVIMYIQPRPGRQAGPDSGMMDALFAHELSHALMYRLYPSYFAGWPSWLSEGLADTWSERAVAGSDVYCAPGSIWYSSFILDVREALEEGHYIPLDKLFEDAIVGHDFRYRQLHYAECFALVRWLDAPGKAKPDADRRAKFDALVKYACALPKDGDVKGQINAKFSEIFGNMTVLERDLVHTVMAEPTAPWQIVFRELRAVPNTDQLVLETFPEAPALAISTEAPIGPIARIQAEADVADVGHKQADLVFAFRSHDDFHVIAYAPGSVTLMHYTGKWETLKSENVDPKLFAPGKHRLLVDVDCVGAWVKLDGKLLMHVVLPDTDFGKGRWGVGGYDARITFRAASGANK